MIDIIERLRRPIVRVNAEVALLCEAAIRAADEIERLRTGLRDMRDRAEAAEEDAMPDDLARELDRLRHERDELRRQLDECSQMLARQAATIRDLTRPSGPRA